MKIVINSCYGGFGLSHEAMMLYAMKKGIDVYPYFQSKSKFDENSNNKEDEYTRIDTNEDTPESDFDLIYYSLKDHGKTIKDFPEKSKYLSCYDMDRSDKALVEVVEELGKKADRWASELSIVEIPDGISWHIEEYDGIEHVAEDHRTWS